MRPSRWRAWKGVSVGGSRIVQPGRPRRGGRWSGSKRSVCTVRSRNRSVCFSEGRAGPARRLSGWRLVSRLRAREELLHALLAKIECRRYGLRWARRPEPTSSPSRTVAPELEGTASCPRRGARALRQSRWM